MLKFVQAKCDGIHLYIVATFDRGASHWDCDGLRVSYTYIQSHSGGCLSIIAHVVYVAKQEVISKSFLRV